MLFIELRFFIFFAAALGIYWLLSRNAPRKVWLLCCSYFFYGAWDWRFLSLIFITTGVDYVASMRIEQAAGRRSRHAWILVSMGGNLFVLGFFKYYDFFAESLVSLAEAAGFHLTLTTLSIVLPVGISFYTFHTMSYTLDVYAGKMRAERSFLDVALFVAFFPALVAGPIMRARDFLPQLRSAREFGQVDVRTCLVIFLIGFVKKACVADNVSPYVDAYFAAPHEFNALAAWIAVVLYAVQIYCDFSGYSDMAVGTAGLLGYHLPVNFRSPYLASGIDDFWHRWHISLSTWLRDYLYIPLGGNRCTRLRSHVNLMATMLLGGLWHGAAWRFVVWGGLHGGALAVQREWRRLVPEGSVLARIVSPLSTALTFYWVCITWIFFRAETFAQAMETLWAFVLLRSPGTKSLPAGLLALFALLAVVHWIATTWASDAWWRKAPVPVFSVAYGALFAIAVGFVPVQIRPFIYFQF